MTTQAAARAPPTTPSTRPDRPAERQALMGKQAHDIGVQKRRRQALERQRLSELRSSSRYPSLRSRKAN